MSIRHHTSLGPILGLSLALLVGCSEGHVPTEAVEEPTFSPRGNSGMAAAAALATLERTTEIAEGRCAVAVEIGPKGGSVTCEEAGLRLVFPPGAVNEKVAITVEVPYGELVGYEFFPEGLEFQAPVRLHQRLKGTTAEGIRAPGLIRRLVGAYVEEVDGVVDPLAVYTVHPSTLARSMHGPRRGGRSPIEEIFFEIEHFSGYITASN